MASCGLEGTPPSESFLSRKKKEIVERSMALFQRSLDRCLDNPVSAPAGALAQGAAARRRAKRARDCDGDDAHDENAAVEEAATETGGGGGGRAKKKRAIREGNGKKFACPFCKHDPVKYRTIKTCCGPGWEDVHRVKEHIYRRHLLKNYCPRCFEHFDKAESLKNHQRADVPCKVRDRGPDTITEEQEKLLRARAKARCTEESKWEDMYQIIFPGQKVPSPYYDPKTDFSPESEKSRFKNLDEARAFLRVEIPKLVKPLIEKYVAEQLEEVQGRVNQKTAEIAREVEAKLLRTFHFQEEQSSTLVSSASSQGAGAATGEPSPPPSPTPELSNLTNMLESMKDDPIANDLCGNLHFDLEELLANTQGIAACDDFSVDSAYYSNYTLSSNGGHGAYGMGGSGYVPQYDSV